MESDFRDVFYGPRFSRTPGGFIYEAQHTSAAAAAAALRTCVPYLVEGASYY